ncbi:MAG: hypothetical protein ACUVYA_08265, partial [Planctomycetota bacterium]
MHPVRENPAARALKAAVAAGLSCLAVFAPRFAPAEEAEEAEERRPPAAVRLPPAGSYEAAEILPLAARLSGRTVLVEGEGLEETPVRIPEILGGAAVNLEGLKLVLRASKVYLHDLRDPEGGGALVATGRPGWKPEPKSVTRIVEVPSGDFDAIAAKVQEAVEDRNAALPEGAEPMVCLPVPAKRKVVISSPRKEDVEAVAAKVGELGKALEEAAKKRPRMYLYVGKHRKVAEIEKDLLEELSDAERNLLRMVVTGKGNRLLLRCPPEVWRRVSSILEKLDVPE